MSKTKKIILSAIIITASGLSAALFLHFRTPAVLNALSYSYTYEGTPKESVYDFMRALQTEGKLSFAAKNYAGMGAFVETLNGVSNTGAKNWIYYVDGKEAGVGISNYKLNPGDMITWKYESSY